MGKGGGGGEGLHTATVREHAYCAALAHFEIRKGFIPNMKRPGRHPPPMPKVSLSTYRRILGVLLWAERVKGLSQQASMLNLKVEVLFGIV
jgi:hypothetical protein